MARKGFDEASAGYDSPAMRFFDNSAEYLVGRVPLRGDERVLDAATGTGKVAFAAAGRLKAGEVIGVDLSDGMLDRARKKARAAGLRNISFQRADIERVDFPRNHFDGLFCSFGVFFWPDMEAVLEKPRAMVKPGGFIAITSFADGSFCPHSDLCLERFKQYGVKLSDSYTWQKLDSQQKHFELLNKAGLTGVDSHTKSVGYYLKDAGEWWDIVYYTGFRSFLNQLSPQQVGRYKEEHVAEIRKTADAEGILLKVDVIFTVAHK
jgi:ubiquinone/menaquinone biosynthesis C-methylase UbiE